MVPMKVVDPTPDLKRQLDEAQVRHTALGTDNSRVQLEQAQRAFNQSQSPAFKRSYASALKYRRADNGYTYHQMAWVDWYVRDYSKEVRVSPKCPVVPVFSSSLIENVMMNKLIPLVKIKMRCIPMFDQQEG